MKISELLIEERFKDYVKRLQQTLGQKSVNGDHAHVFAHPVYHNVVVRVHAKDPGYDNFLRWARANQHNKFVPKIIDSVVMKDKTGDDITITFMERLEPTKRKEYDKFCQLIGDLGCGGKRKELPDVTSSEWKKAAKNTQDRDLADLAKFVASIGHNDIGWGNTMKRPDGQLVVTDPTNS